MPPDGSPEAKHFWYGLRTKSKFEKAVTHCLTNLGYEPYLPCYRQRRQWSDRMAEIDAPLFPGYVFCQFDAARRLPILQAPGVVGVVGIGREPAAIPDGEIAAIRRIIDSGMAAMPWPYLAQGQRVRINRGPLRDMEGIFVRRQANEWRIVVSVHLLQRSVSVEVDSGWIERA
jgi:transcription antitermination factor NusG